MVFDSFGVGLLLDGRNQSYRAVVATAAATLATRFSPVVGMTRSWGAADDHDEFEVIVDNLMNLELLFWQVFEGLDGLPSAPAVTAADHAAAALLLAGGHV